MKKIILIVISAVFAFSNMEAQTYFETKDCWTQATVSDQGGMIIRQYQYFVDNDTTINGKVFKTIKARYPENSEQLQYIGSIRTDSKKVYANVVLGVDTINDVLLYDFSVEKGDTVWGLPLSSTANLYTELNMTKVVTGTDSIELLNGEKRKRIYIDGTEPWIEGIGSVNGLFNPAYPISTTSTVYNFVSCFKQNNVELYHNNTWCHENCCDLLTKVQKPIESKGNSILYPVATENYVQLETFKPATFIEISDAFGRCLKNLSDLALNKYTLDFTNYSTGIYFVIIHFNNSREVHKIVKML